MRTFVVPDLHGRVRLAIGLLHEAGLIDDKGKRDKDVQTVQLGDLANCVLRDRDEDISTLELADKLFDVLLVGNHEAPYFKGPAFSGFYSIPEVKELVESLNWQPAVAIGDTLLTHAGLVPELGVPGETAKDVWEALTEAWQVGEGRHEWFAQIGWARGGSAQYGGVLWSDFTAETRDDRFNQVHGHTPLKYVLKEEHENGKWALDLDAGGHGHVTKITGVFLDDNGEIDSWVTYDSEEDD